jgi:bifunctional DNase/RNase
VSTAGESNWVEVAVAEVRRSGGADATGQLHAVILQERDGPRRLPIYVGPPEAVYLACSLEAIEMPRPMTYQLAASLVGATRSMLTEVRITRLAESTFYAVVVLDGPAGLAEVDARPSDALNLALVCGAPIRVDANLLDDPEAQRYNAWENFPTGAPQLVAEVQERHARTMRAILPSMDEAEGDQS